MVRKALPLFMLVPLLFATASYEDCDRVQRKKSQDPRLFEDAGPAAIFKTCERQSCDHAVYVNDDCKPVDSSGNALDRINVHVGDRVCFFNDSQCEVKFKHNPELFSAPSEPLEPGDCKNLIVLRGAIKGKTYSYEILCDCEDGHGVGNPEVHVEEEDEEDP